MKKRVLSLLLAVCTAVSLLVLPAGAASVTRFSDVSDASTSTNAEVLRLMGVIDGYGDGTFRPDQKLNRAQFCKMVTYAMNAQDRLGLYRTVTVFPDVKPSHWAAPYINLASRTSASGAQVSSAAGEEGGAAAGVQPIIAGFPDGKFHPERTINMGQAVTILLRVLGYEDGKIGGVWPDSYLATASVVGLLKGIQTDGYAPVTRSQAAQLFVNLLRAQKPGGSGTLYTISEEEVSFDAVDGGRGVVKYNGTKEIQMVHPTADSALVGMTGRLVTDGNNRLLTFLPEFGGSSSGTGSAAGAVVLYGSDADTTLTQLAGNNSYTLYKNGSPASAGDLKKYDVATYYPATNSVLVCDTRVGVFYEDAEPNPKNPATIKVLGGTQFHVLPTAQESLSKFKPGEQMILLLTADGRVAGAVSPDDTRSNALAYVDEAGAVTLFVGSTTKTLSESLKPDEKYYGQVVRIYAAKKDTVEYSIPSGGVTGDLDVQARTLGSKHLSQGVLIFYNGKQMSLGELNRKIIPSDQVRYAHTNWAGEVDIVVIDRATDEIYGRVEVETVQSGGEGAEGGSGHDEQFITVTYPGGKVGPVKSGNRVNTGDYVAVEIGNLHLHDGEAVYFKRFEKLNAIKKVPNTAWTGKTLVQAGGKTYEVPEDVACYNKNLGDWISLDKALAYGDSVDIYVKDGVVRIIEVR